MNTLINRSYRTPTRRERFVACVFGHESPIKLGVTAFIIVFGTLFVVLGAGVAYGAELSNGDVPWGECKGSGWTPDTPECAGYSMGLKNGLALAEEARQEAELERKKEALESLIRQQENADLGLRADAMLLEQVATRLTSALDALPPTSPNRAGRVELMSAIEMIEGRISEIVFEQQRLKTRLENFERLLADPK
jgi:hypothetical protein